MIRALQAETLRYGHYSMAGEFVYDHPFQWGSKRTGPDLHRVGGKYSDEWQAIHLNNPRDLVPESNMPGYPWMAKVPANAADIGSVNAPMSSSMRRRLWLPGHPTVCYVRAVRESMRRMTHGAVVDNQ
jgi:cytochrome c oxidase cbb3-type subunit 2